MTRKIKDNKINKTNIENIKNKLERWKILLKLQVKSIQFTGMKRQNRGKIKWSKLRNILGLQNVRDAENQCHTTSRQKANSRWSMSGADAAP